MSLNTGTVQCINQKPTKRVSPSNLPNDLNNDRIFQFKLEERQNFSTCPPPPPQSAVVNNEMLFNSNTDHNAR